MSPLQHAIIQGDLETIEHILERDPGIAGRRVFSSYRGHGHTVGPMTPLAFNAYFATGSRWREGATTLKMKITRALLNTGVDLLIQDPYDDTSALRISMGILDNVPVENLSA